MAFNGLLQGAMKGIQGGAEAGVYAAKGLYDDQRKVDVSKQLADIEEEKLLRIDEVKRQRDIADIPLKGAAETQVAVDRGNNKDYLTAERNVAKAKHIESQGSIAQAALANFQLASQQEIQGLRSKLASTNDEGEREAIKQKISDLSPNSKGSYADVASVGNGYRLMAKEAREDAKNAMNDDERGASLKKAQDYETMADAVFKSVTEKRGVGGDKTGGKPEAPKGPTGPWDNFKK